MKTALGWLLAVWYAACGKRARLLRHYDRPGTCLALVGHDPKARDLERLLRWYLKRGFTFIRPDLPPDTPKGRLAWLSFDDGWMGFKTEVLPVLEKLKVPATVFVAPHETEQGQLWSNAVCPSLGRARVCEMWRLPRAERQAVVDRVLAETGNPRRLMTKADVVALSRHPLVDVENHTMTHLSCAYRPVDEVIAEAREASRTLKAWTGKDCRLVCYPFCHCTAETDRALRAEGFVPVRGDAGEGSLGDLGQTRNMFRDSCTLQENVARSLNAWRRVKIWGMK